MTNMFEFTDELISGSDIIDDQHKKLISNINILVNLDLNTINLDYARKVLENLEDYANFHFKEEEEFMQKINYPSIEAHKNAHKYFKDRVASIDIKESTDVSEVIKLFTNFLIGWLVVHIKTSDKDFIQFEKNQK